MMVRDLKIDATDNPKLFRKAFSAAVGVAPLPDDLTGPEIIEDVADKVGVSVSEATRLASKIMQREILTEGVNQRLRQSFDDPMDIRRDNGRMPSFTEVMQRAGKFGDSGERAEFARQAIADSRLTNRPRFDPSINNDPLLKEMSDAHIRDHLHGWVVWAERASTALGNPKASVWHKVMESYRAKKIILGKVFEDGHGVERAHQKIGSEHDIFFAEEPQIILIEHDWAAAFAGAQDFSDGEFPLPYEHCAFEFLLDGRHVVMVTHSHQCIVVSEIGLGYWVATIVATLGEKSLDWYGRYQVLGKNIRAVCIALDAEVAETSVVRAPHRLNMARDKQGKSPIRDYHVINLTRRSRVDVLPSADHEPRWHPRLHFRRGHWRHFDNHKTWIKWMLVGNPDLGFIDKEYRA